MSVTIKECPGDELVARAVGDFASSLGLARAVWQRYPELVESRDLAEPFLTAQLESQESDDFDEILGESALIGAGVLKQPCPVCQFNQRNV